MAGNLLWASPQATPEEIASVLETAEASAFVSNLPQGLETPIGEGGKRISGGEKQRLAAARALLMRPRLLLMDAGTSALAEATARQAETCFLRSSARSSFLQAIFFAGSIRL